MNADASKTKYSSVRKRIFRCFLLLLLLLIVKIQSLESVALWKWCRLLCWFHIYVHRLISLKRGTQTINLPSSVKNELFDVFGNFVRYHCRVCVSVFRVYAHITARCADSLRGIFCYYNSTYMFMFSIFELCFIFFWSSLHTWGLFSLCGSNISNSSRISSRTLNSPNDKWKNETV